MGINKMIDLKFGLFWTGGKLSYLRYLTFVSLRKYHPDATIELYVSDEWSKSGYSWGCEKQDFEEPSNGKDYMSALKDLNVDIIKVNIFSKYPPNYQSDFFRWWWLKKNGGFYLDTDQIVLKSFEDIDRDCDFIYSAYIAPSCGFYTPVGVIGSTKDAEIVQWINDMLPKYYDPRDYNSLGPFMLRSVVKTRKWRDKLYNTPSQMFYPILDSCYVGVLYGDSHSAAESALKNVEKAYALHWYGGHPESQRFNKSFNEEKAQTSLCLLAGVLRNKRII